MTDCAYCRNRRKDDGEKCRSCGATQVIRRLESPIWVARDLDPRQPLAFQMYQQQQMAGMQGMGGYGCSGAALAQAQPNYFDLGPLGTIQSLMGRKP